MDKLSPKTILILVFALLCFVIGGIVGGAIKTCPSCEPLGIRIDTIYQDTTLKLVSVSKPTPKKVITKRTAFKNDLKIFNEVVARAMDSFVPTVRIYSDTFYEAKNYKAVVNDTVAGEIVGRSFQFTNLRPLIRETIIMPVKQPLLKVYAGAYIGSSFVGTVPSSFRGGIAIDGIVKDNHMIGLQGGLNSALQGELQVKYAFKIRLK